MLAVLATPTTARSATPTTDAVHARPAVTVGTDAVVHTAPVASAADGATRGADDYRTGWYPDQSGLSPGLVTGGTFGQLFDTSVTGSVYGQPLVDDGQLLVNTEDNYSYGLDPVTGTVLWSRQYGAPVQAADLGCGDLSPDMGVTSTAVVDQSTDIEYVVDNEYVSGGAGAQAYYMHALELDDGGAEAPGFPVQIQGSAQNLPGVQFNAEYQIQRPGLLLLGGVVYVAFAGHCDDPPYEGWVAGVSEAGALTAMWASATSGAGIWMSGGGLVSDGPATMLLTTGNGGSGQTPSTTTPGTSPPSGLGESVVRLDVQSDGTLKAVDFFTPYDGLALDGDDLDFGSGSPVALPDQYFGTSSIPHLAVAVGKEGYVYLLNRDNLGGADNGPNGTDDVVGRYGPNGGVWSSPAVWPGDGGWVYIPTAAGAVSAGGSSGQLDAYQYVVSNGTPTLSLAGQSSDAFGFGSSAPVVTSDGTTSGSALLWEIWSPDGTGVGAQLRAYDPVPVDGVMQEVWDAPIGTASKFNPPGIGANRVYVGTRDGHVIGFGAPVTAPVTAPSPTFPTTVVGQSSTEDLTITAATATTVTGLTVSAGAFSLGTPSPTLPVALGPGDSVTVPVTFTPTAGGTAGAYVTVTTSTGDVTEFPLSATGELSGPSLQVSTNGVSFGGIPPGQAASQTVGFFNNGSTPLTVSTVTLPGAPFSVTGAPTGGSTIAPGAEVVANVTFSPTVVGHSTDTLVVDSDGGEQVVTLTGVSTASSVLRISPLALSYGSVGLGSARTESFTLTDVGGSSLTISKSKPPVRGSFDALTTLPEGTTLAAGQSITERVRFVPTTAGTATDQWIINADDGLGVRTVSFTGDGIAPSISTGSLPVATSGAPYSATLVGSGGTTPYTWSVVSGALPAGLTLDPDGVISGTPVAAGSSSPTVRLEAQGGLTATRTLSLVVNPPPETLGSPTVGMAATPDGGGYWIADSAGDVRTLGDAVFAGSMSGHRLNAPIAHIVPSADGKGYWLVASDGGIFAFGDAPFYGSTGGQHLNAPVVSLAPTTDGRGYWLVATDGGIFAFGNARFHGSTGGIVLHRPVVGMAVDPTTGGYWLVATDGGIFAFDAPFLGSPGGTPLVQPVVGMAVDPTTGGYWLAAADGGVFAYGAPFYGSGIVVTTPAHAVSLVPGGRALLPVGAR